MTTMLNAQISITPEDLPNINTIVSTNNVANPNIDVGTASSSAQSWDFSALNTNQNVKVIDFDTPENFENFEQFPNATFARSSDDLNSLFGVTIEDFFPEELTLEPPYTAFYSTNADGDVYLEGVDLGLSLLGGILDFGRKTFTADQAYRFWATGNYGDELPEINASTEFFLSIPFEELAEPLGLDSTAACFDFSDLGFGELCIKDFYIKLNLNTQTTIDAFGDVNLPETTQEVLRYNELTTVDLTLLPNVIGEAFPNGFELPYPLLQTICPIDIQGVDFCILFQDTTFTQSTYRFYGKEHNFPFASVQGNTSNGNLSSVQFIVPPDDLVPSFDIDTTFNNCQEYTFTYTGTEPVSSYLWDFGDGNISTESNPTHQYAENGTYTIGLTVENGFETVTITTEFVVDCPELEASFSYAANPGDCLDITFTNTTAGYYWTSARWLFGDGENTINLSETVNHQYDFPGVYEVTLIIQNFGIASDTFTQVIVVCESELMTEGNIDYIDNNPYPQIEAGTQSIDISLSNNGNIPLDSISVQWSINDTMGSSTYNNLDLAAGDSTSIELLSFNFEEGEEYLISFWTADGDTSYLFVIAGLENSCIAAFDSLSLSSQSNCIDTVYKVNVSHSQALEHPYFETLFVLLDENDQIMHYNTNGEFDIISNSFADYCLVGISYFKFNGIQLSLGNTLDSISDDLGLSVEDGACIALSECVAMPACLIANDASIVELLAPATATSIDGGLEDIVVSLSNLGVVDLSLATINWTVDGIPQTSFEYVPDSPLVQNELDSLNIGSFDFTEDTLFTLQIWSELPNGQTDEVTSNDTLTVEISTLYPVGLADLTEKKNGIKISPVPAKGFIQIHFEEALNQHTQLSIYNTLGQQMSESIQLKALGQTQHLIDIHHLTSGLYFMEIQMGEQLESIRFLVE